MISEQNKKLRILYVIPTMGGGGAEIMLGAIIEKLFALGHEILLVCMYPMDETYDNFPNKEFIDKNIRIVECKTRVLFSFKKRTTITDDHFKQIVEEFQPDVIHSHLFESEILSRSYSKKGVAYFSHGHDNMWQLTRIWNATKINKQTLTNLLERAWLIKKYKQTNTAFIAISKDVRSFFKNNLPKSLHQNACLLYNAIDIARFHIENQRLISVGEKLRIVSVGNLVPKKNHRFLIDIAVELKQQNRDFSIDILGYGELQKELEQFALQKNVSEFIFFRGNVRNVEDYLKNANVYIHPANYEPFGLVLIEAMASGLPVICLDGKGNRDIMHQGKNGYIFEEENAELFANALKSLFEDPQAYSYISNYARDFAKNYDIGTYVENLIEIYSNKLKHEH
jgi:glycosyltransferase involved in cell wall biosynthesis